MYTWIWRHLPFGRAGRVIGSLLLAGLAAALLWYVIFPWAEPLLPFDDVQVTDGGDTGGTGDIEDPGGAGVEEPAGDENDLPYGTTSNNPAPSATRSR